MADSGRISDCPHLSDAVGFLSERDFDTLLAVLHCDVCGGGDTARGRKRSEADAGTLWLCVFPDCFMLGCSEGPDHSTRHNKNYPDHCVQMNVGTGRFWCYECNAEVVVRQQVARFGALVRPQAEGGAYEAVPPASGAGVNGRRGRRPPSGLSSAKGLVGLSNLGNTCYMNAALQCLLNTPSLTEFFVTCPALVNYADRNALSKSYKRLVDDIWGPRGNESSFVPPANVLHAIKTKHPMFRGFHQHDTQEFLRCFMDQMHEELCEPMIDMDEPDESDNLDSVSEVGSAAGSDVAPVEMEDGDRERTTAEGGDGDEDDAAEEYETADSGVSEQSSGGSEASTGAERRRQPSGETGLSMAMDSESGVGSGITAASSRLSDGDQDQSDDYSTPDVHSPLGQSPSSYNSRPGVTSAPKSPSRAPASAVQPLLKNISVIRKRRPKTYRSVISDIFDGKLVSSVQCLTCDRVSLTTETFQDLSLPIPTPETLSALRSQPVPNVNSAAAVGGDGWFSWAWTWVTSWFYGPNITLNDCLSYFFSADELKGDNMYSCEKCKKLRNGLKYSRVTILPDTLCIHLKRFRHDFAFSSKISSKVTFPLVDLDMAPWLHKDSASKVSLYDLSGVICHHGSAGGGHYTAYALNPIDEDWYEFDDSTVTKVDPGTVMSAEAYVLFYRKNGTSNEAYREKMQSLLALNQESPSLIKFYVSRQWINKFETFAEPGPIDNSDFLCHHGGVLPSKTSFVLDLCVALPQQVWEHLHSTFGGGPACTRLYECANCRAELDALTRQKKFELEEFKTLHQEFQEQEAPSAIYCLSSSWFKVWEGFVTGRQRDPPGPIDNRAIIVSSANPATDSKQQQQQQQTLRQGSDYLQVSEEIWKLFHSIYGGGPDVMVRPNGSVIVSGGGTLHSSGSGVVVDGGGAASKDGRKHSLPALSTRLRARSASTCEAMSTSPQPSLSQQQQQRPPRPGYVTRSKSSKSETCMMDQE